MNILVNDALGLSEHDQFVANEYRDVLSYRVLGYRETEICDGRICSPTKSDSCKEPQRMDLMFKQDSLRTDDTLGNGISVGVEFGLKQGSSDELLPPLSPSKISLHMNPSALKIDAEIDVEIPSKKEQPRSKHGATMHQNLAASVDASAQQDSALPSQQIQAAATTPEAPDASVGKQLDLAQLEILALKAQLTKSTEPKVEQPGEEQPPEPPEAEGRQQW